MQDCPSELHDLFFTTGRGQVVSYNPEEHGIWEIYENEFGGLGIRQQALIDEVDLEDELDQEEHKDLVRMHDCGKPVCY